MTRTSSTVPQSRAGVATAERGIVMLDGPDGVAVTMTAEAADKTGKSLIAAAEQASTQRTGS
ncbi:MAG: hypothetical protein EOP62_18150 [Sphingomonadales bacterium]|nr:MAG: hypothetical protein EOP62_18150 [Sphingomonadales bacterium]